MPQSDIPSQELPRGRVANPGLPVAIPGPSGFEPVNEQQNVGGFTVSTYESRPSNGIDYIFQADLLSEFASVPQNFSGVEQRFIVPTGFVFVARMLDIVASIVYRVVPPYAAPAAFENLFLTDVSGFANTPTNYDTAPAPLDGGAPVLRVNILVNDNPTPYYNLMYPNGFNEDLSVPLFYPIDEGSIIRVQIVRNINTVPTSLYGSQIQNVELSLSGTLIPSTGLTASDETLTRAPVPVTR